MQSQKYLFGDSRAEAARLRAQALLLEGATRQFLTRAGIAPGMRVLDAGCGAGDVTLCLAELVGPAGAVVGVDLSPTILETARRRAEEASFGNVRFVEGDISTAAIDGDFDAVVGRCMLFFVPDRVAALRRLRRLLRPGGLIAFQEPGNATVPPSAVPPSPLLSQLWGWLRAVYERSGADVFGGLRLFGLFKQAGLPEPQMHLEALVGGGAGWGGYEYMASLARLLLPRMIELGVATEAEVAVDTLADRLREELTAQDSAAVTLSFVSAWARVPAPPGERPKETAPTGPPGGAAAPASALSPSAQGASMRAGNFQLRQYLARIGLAGEVTADLAGVTRMMRHQLFTVPFENLDVQTGKVVSLAPEDIVRKLVAHRRGGLCYEVNGLFSMALTVLGVPHQYIAARPMTYPEQRPKTHMALLVTLDHERWLCDLGFGSQCIRAPLPLRRVNQEITQDGQGFLLEKAEGREYVLKARVGDQWVAQYGFDLSPQEWVDFLPAHYFNYSHPDSIFVRKHFVVLHSERGYAFLFGNVLKTLTDGVAERREISAEESVAILEQHFNLSFHDRAALLLSWPPRWK